MFDSISTMRDPSFRWDDVCAGRHPSESWDLLR
jgi:hypothetical protein